MNKGSTASLLSAVLRWACEPQRTRSASPRGYVVLTPRVPMMDGWPVLASHFPWNKARPCSWDWGAPLPLSSYPRQCGTADKSLCHARLAAGRGSPDKACLYHWALLFLLALCLHPVPQRRWWRCKWKTIGHQKLVRGQRLKSQMRLFRMGRWGFLVFSKGTPKKNQMGRVLHFSPEGRAVWMLLYSTGPQEGVGVDSPLPAENARGR